MTDYQSFVPGTSSYTTSSNIGGNFNAFGGYGAGGLTEEVTTTTTHTTPYTNTEVIERGIESAFGTNTAEGYFGGSQANVQAQAVATADFSNFNRFDGDGFFGGGASQVITTVEQQVAQPAVTYTQTQTYLPPPPAPVAPAVNTYNAYQDYNTNFNDYAEVPKKQSFCNLRNILLGLAGLLALGALLGGLIALLRHLFKGKSSAAIPSYLIPQTAPVQDVPIYQTQVVQPAIVQPAFDEPIQPFLQPYVQPQQFVQPGYSQEQLNNALKAAIAAGALPAIGAAGYGAYSAFGGNAGAVAPALAGGLSPFTHADIPQLLALRKQEGKFTAKTLKKLGMTEDQYKVLLGNAYATGLINKQQLEQLALNGKIAPYLEIGAGAAALGAGAGLIGAGDVNINSGAALNPNVLGGLNAFSPADVQQLLGIAKQNGKFKAKNLSKIGMNESQFLSSLTNSYRAGLVSEPQLSALGVAINEQGQLGLEGSAGFGFRNKLNNAWNKLLGRSGVSTTNNILETLSNTALPHVNPAGFISY